MDILYIPFGYIMKFCCLIAGNNYVIALFFFALLLQVVLFPLGIKQQKSQITMAKLRPKEMAIRKKYAGRTDKPTQQKMNMEIQQLYADNGYNPLSGCLPLLIQLPIIIALFTVVRNPITYTVNLGGNELDTHNLYVDAVTMIEEARTRIPADTEDEDLKALAENLIAWEKTLGAKLNDQNEYQGEVEPVNNGTSEYLLVQMISFGGDSINTVLESKSLEPIQDTFGAEIKEEMPNFNIIGGVSALQTPTFGFNWLLLVPILVFLSSYLSGIVMRKLSTTPENANAPRQRDVYEGRYAADFGVLRLFLPGGHRHLLDFPNRSSASGSSISFRGCIRRPSSRLRNTPRPKRKCVSPPRRKRSL